MTGSKRVGGAMNASAAKRLKDFANHHAAPLPAGLAAVQEAPLMQQSVNVHEEMPEEANMYETQSISTAILDTFTQTVPPTNALMHGSPIEFLYQSGTDQYVALEESVLRVFCRITKADGTAIAADAKVAPINNVLHSLFQQVEVYIGTTKVTEQTTLYPYIALLGQLLSFEPAMMEMKEGEGMYLDTGNVALASAQNPGWEARRERFALSRQVELLGRPFVPIFMQDKLIPGGTQIRMRLHPSKDEFVLHAAANDAEKYKLQIMEAAFMLKVKKVAPSMLEAHTRALQKAPFRYKYTSIWPKSHIVTAGAPTMTINSMFDGNLPDRLTMGLVDATHANGTYHTNPFLFQHCQATNMQIECNGSLIPGPSGEMDFGDSDRTALAYAQMLMSLGVYFGVSPPSITRKMWKNGYTVYSHQVLPWPEDGEAKAPSKQGTISIHGKFRAPLVQNMTLIAIAEFRGRWMELDAWHNVAA